MSFWSILGGLLPLIVFVIADSFFGLKKGILLAIVAALLELILSLILFKTIDFFTGSSLFLICVMGVASWKMKSALLFKMQPVVVGVFFSLVFLISYIIDKPILTLMLVKYKSIFSLDVREKISNPLVLQWFDLSTLYCGLSIFAQSMLVAWAAVKLNNWWWLIFRGVGFYLFFSLGGFLALAYVRQSQLQ